MTEETNSVMIHSYEKKLNTIIRKTLEKKGTTEVKFTTLFEELRVVVKNSIEAYREQLETIVLKELEDESLLKTEDSNIEQTLFSIYEKELSNQFKLVIIENPDYYMREEDVLSGTSRYFVKLEDDVEEAEKIVGYKYSGLLNIDFDMKAINNHVRKYIETDIFLMIRYIESEGKDGFISKENTEVSPYSYKHIPIYSDSFEDFHKRLHNEKTKVDIVLTDPPYFIKMNPIWDNEKSPEDRKFYFKEYLKTLIPVIKENSVLMIFNDFMNIEIIQDAINEIRDGLANWSEDEGRYKEISDFLYEYDIDLDKMSKVERYKLFDFNILGFLEWTKSNPSSSINSQNSESYGEYKGSEYLIVAMKNFENNPRRKKFERLIYEPREIFDSVNPDSSVRDKDIRIHDTTKSSIVLKNLIMRLTNEEDLILDSFSGSGAISIACYETSRQSIACEIDNYMYRMSVGRYEMVRKLIGKSPFPFDFYCDYQYEAKYSNFEETYVYKKYEPLIEEVYISAIEPLTRKQRIEYSRRSLTRIIENIIKKSKKKTIRLKYLEDDEIAFLLGFGKDYLHTKRFQYRYGVSRANPIELFEAFNDKDTIDSLKKKLKVSSDDIELLVKIETAESNGKFLIDKSARFSEIIFNQFGYNIDHLVTLFKNQKALSNFKNKDKKQRLVSYEKYSDYILEILEVLFKHEDKAKEMFGKRTDYSSKDFETAKYYYKLVTKLITYLIYLDHELGGMYAEEVIQKPKQLISNYLLLIDDDDIKSRLQSKLGISETDEYEDFLDIHPAIRNCIRDGLIDSISLLKNLSPVKEFKFSSINHKLNSLFVYSTQESERNNMIKLVGSIKNVDKLTPTDFKKELVAILEDKFEELSKLEIGAKGNVKTEIKKNKIGKAERQIEVEKMLKEGKKAKQIAKELHLTYQTINNDRKEIEARNTPKA